MGSVELMVIRPVAMVARQTVCVLFLIQALVVIAVVVRAHPWVTGDSMRYVALAELLQEGQGFGLIVDGEYEPEGWRMPGYPVFIAASRILFGESLLPIIIAQGVLFLVSVWLVYRAAWKLFGQPMAIVFLALSSAYPFVAYNVGQISAEIPTVFLVALAFFLLTLETSWAASATGAAFGLAAYFRPNLFLLGLVVAAAYLLANRRAHAKAGLIALGTVAAVLPWTVRNYTVFGRFTPTPVIKGTGHSTLLATWQSRVPVSSLVDYGMRGSVTDEMRRLGMAEQIADLNRRLGMPENTVFVTPESYPTNEKKMEADRLFGEAAFTNIKSWPLTYLRSSLVNMFRIWFSAQMTGVPQPLKGVLILQGVLCFLAGILGLVLALQRLAPAGRPFVYAAVGACAYFTVTLCWLHTEARYTIPIRLILLLFSAYALTHLLSPLIGRFSQAGKGLE
jgi:4-amino-4-deoxy-L-arabinose transferase-like glycosyltransferase